MNSLIAIILFLSIHKIEIGHLMMPNRFGGRNFEVGESSRRNEGRERSQQSSSGIIRRQRKGWEKCEKIIIN
jgi:hypothetical protein